jgi:hypothetical protein
LSPPEKEVRVPDSDSRRATLPETDQWPAVANPDCADSFAGLAEPDLIRIIGDQPGEFSFGCDQDWYPDSWQRRAGCGPCTAATLLFYLARRYTDLAHLYALPSGTRADFTRFMQDIWQYVTPGNKGVNEAAILSGGVCCFAATRQVQLDPVTLVVPGIQQSRRPSLPEMVRFIRSGLCQDSPVAFLNLSNGKLPNLDSWHWVLITTLSGNGEPEAQATVSDSGLSKQLDLGLWHRTSLLGGSFVYFIPGSGSSPAANPPQE